MGCDAWTSHSPSRIARDQPLLYLVNPVRLHSLPCFRVIGALNRYVIKNTFLLKVNWLKIQKNTRNDIFRAAFVF
jgi:hypothetical protein